MMDKDLHQIRESTHDLRLLYVEDDVDARTNTLKLFEHFFDRIDVAENGQEGYDAFKANEYDLVISDINMPQMNGLEMLERIRSRNSDIPVLFLSAFNEAEYLMAAIKHGIDAFIVKPVEINQLLGALSKTSEKIELRKIKQRYREELESELDKRTAELNYKLHYDELTGLKNRYSFFESEKTQHSRLLYLIDIEKFHVINDIYGHEAGSQVLVEFSKLIEKLSGENGCECFRISADEFAMVKTVEPLETEACETFIDTLFESIKNLRIVTDVCELTLNAHVGVAYGNGHLYQQADIALEHAKRMRINFAFYNKTIDRTEDHNILIAKRDMIRNALEHDLVIPVFQPIVDSAGKIVKHETLMRIESTEESGLIPPYEFLDASVKTGFYSDLSFSLIGKALETLENMPDIVLSVNFNYVDIVNTKLAKMLEEKLESAPGLGDRLIFEITEDESLENYDVVNDFISRFRAYGIRIAIDDFGTGFSNFGYLLELEPDYIKIDGSLIRNIDTDQNAYTLSEAIINFSHKMGMRVIAEFVHSEQVFTMLKAMGVDEYQGFYFSEPLRKIEQ